MKNDVRILTRTEVCVLNGYPRLKLLEYQLSDAPLTSRLITKAGTEFPESLHPYLLVVSPHKIT